MQLECNLESDVMWCDMMCVVGGSLGKKSQHNHRNRPKKTFIPTHFIILIVPITKGNKYYARKKLSPRSMCTVWHAGYGLILFPISALHWEPLCKVCGSLVWTVSLCRGMEMPQWPIKIDAHKGGHLRRKSDVKWTSVPQLLGKWKYRMLWTIINGI